MINQVILDKPTVWGQEGWKDRVGGDMIVDMDSAAGPAYKCNLPEMLNYGEAVMASTQEFLTGLSPSELERELTFMPLGFPNNMSVGVLLTTMLLGNTYAHTGEISCLKALLGKRRHRR